MTIASPVLESRKIDRLSLPLKVLDYPFPYYSRLILKEMLIPSSKCEFRYSGGKRGWKGDIPIVRLNTNKIRGMGWSNKLSSSGAIQRSIEEMLLNSVRIYGRP